MLKQLLLIEVLKRVQTLFAIIRINLPSATIDFVSIKPSPVRASIQPRVIIANRLIKAYIQQQKNAAFIDGLSSNARFKR